MKWLYTLGLSVMIACCLFACSDSSISCNSLGAMHSISFVLSPPLSEPGTYNIVTTTQQGAVACDVVVVEDEPFTSVCDSPLDLMVGEHDALMVDWVRLWVDTSTVAPETVTFSLSNSTETLVQDSFTPEYVSDEPNGEGCGIRQQATVEVTY